MYEHLYRRCVVQHCDSRKQLGVEFTLKVDKKKIDLFFCMDHLNEFEGFHKSLIKSKLIVNTPKQIVEPLWTK